MKKGFIVSTCLLFLLSCGSDPVEKEKFVPGLVKLTLDIDAKTISWDPIAGATQYNMYIKQVEACPDISAVPFEFPAKTDTKVADVTSPFSIATYQGDTTCYYAAVAAENAIGEGLLSSPTGWQFVSVP